MKDYGRSDELRFIGASTKIFENTADCEYSDRQNLRFGTAVVVVKVIACIKLAKTGIALDGLFGTQMGLELAIEKGTGLAAEKRRLVPATYGGHGRTWQERRTHPNRARCQPPSVCFASNNLCAVTLRHMVPATYGGQGRTWQERLAHHTYRAGCQPPSVCF